MADPLVIARSGSDEDRRLYRRRYSCAPTASDGAATASGVATRLQVIDSRLRARRPAPFQGSLFDRRAERAALATSASVAAMHAHVARQQSNIASLRAVSIDDAPQLIAGWLRHAE